MGPIERKLEQQKAEFPAHAVNGAATKAVVMRRGRMRLIVAQVVAMLSAASVAVAAAVVVPRMIDTQPELPPILNQGPSEEVRHEEKQTDGVDTKEADKEHEPDPVKEQPAADTETFVKVTSPEDGTTMHEATIKFEGLTEPGAKVTAGPYAANVDGEHWSIVLILSNGKNVVGFRAQDPAGNVAETSVTVYYEPKSDTGQVAFTAHQVNGISDDNPPHDVYWGTAQPETKVWVTSDHGEGYTYANGEGDWELNVEFRTAPDGKAFQVKVKSLATGEYETFEFVAPRPDVGEVEFSATQENNHVENDPPYSFYAGAATPGTHLTVASEYGGAETEADGSGHWRVKVWFEGAPAGTNTWAVVIESSRGDRKVFEYTGTRPAASAVEFTANQKYGTCEEPTPYDVFWGTAQPESKVKVTSEHGSGFAYANGDGQWELRVEFPTAPYGVEFQVTVQSVATGQTKTFAFTSYSSA